MRFAADMFARRLKVPAYLERRRTLGLLAKGLYSQACYDGHAALTPIGLRTREKLEALLGDCARRIGVEQLQLPEVMLNADLHRGQAVGTQFGSKVMSLQAPSQAYHLLCTPEMLFERLCASHVRSYRDLPVRHAYHADFFRRIPDTVPMLRERQIRIFGYLDAGDGSGEFERLREFAAAVEQLIRSLGLTIHAGEDPHEHWVRIDYACAEGDEVGRLGGNGAVERFLSLALGYVYPQPREPLCRFRDSRNRNHLPAIATFGLGTTRLVYALFDGHRDGLGFCLPRSIAPFRVCVIPARGGEEGAERVYRALGEAGVQASLDDRIESSPDERAAVSDYLGISLRAFVRAGTVDLRRRGGDWIGQAEEGSAVALISRALEAEDTAFQGPLR